MGLLGLIAYDIFLTGKCRVSDARIGEILEMSVGSVREYLVELEKEKLIYRKITLNQRHAGWRREFFLTEEVKNGIFGGIGESSTSLRFSAARSNSDSSGMQKE